MGIRRGMVVVVAALALVVGAGCAPLQPGQPVTTTTTPVDWTPPGPGNGVRQNEIQMIGSHNSYHSGLIPRWFEVLTWWTQQLGSLASGFGNVGELNYSHAPLTAQLDSGVRSF